MTTLTVGTKGFDSATRLDPKAVKAAAGHYQMRYSAGVGNTSAQSQWKLCQVGEIEAILASGAAFGANCEWYADRVTEGASAGHADGAADLIFWKSRGLAKGSSVHVSWDETPAVSKFGAVRAYIEAYNTSLGGYYRCDGLYAGIAALIWMSNNSIVRHGWIPSAASWSGADVDIPDNYAPPAKTFHDLWFPTDSQVQPAIAYFAKMLATGNKLVSVSWQCGNQTFSGKADIDYVVKAGDNFGMMLPPGWTPPPKPPTPTGGNKEMTKDQVHQMIANAFAGFQTGNDHGDFTHASDPDIVKGQPYGNNDRLTRLETKAGIDGPPQGAAQPSGGNQ